jgi:hypothetical protein
MRTRLLNRVQALERVSPSLPVKRTFHISLISPDGEKQECILTDRGLVEVSQSSEADRKKQPTK